jgi:hypothetical protein
VKNEEKRTISPTNRRGNVINSIIYSFSYIDYTLFKVKSYKIHFLSLLLALKFLQMKRLALVLLLISSVAFAQRGYRDSNRIGIGAGISKLNIYTDNFSITPEQGWIGGLSVRGNYYNNWQMSFGMFFTDNNFSIPTRKGFIQTQTNFKMSAVQIYIVPSYVAIEDHLNLEFGPVLQVNGKLTINKNDETNVLVDQPGLKAKDIVDVSKINANFYVGINGGFKNIRARIGYQYGLTNFFDNLKNNDNVKMVGDKMKGNIGLISGQITIYL